MYNNNNLSQLLLHQSLGVVGQQQKVIEVTGRSGAEAYQLAPDSSVLLLDNTAPIVWLVKTDGAGYKSMTPYDIKPHEEEKPVDQLKLLEERIEKLEEAINEKSDTSNAKQRK